MVKCAKHTRAQYIARAVASPGMSRLRQALVEGSQVLPSAEHGPFDSVRGDEDADVGGVERGGQPVVAGDRHARQAVGREV